MQPAPAAAVEKNVASSEARCLSGRDYRAGMCCRVWGCGVEGVGFLGFWGSGFRGLGVQDFRV